jgi:hypothetical protein
MIKKKNKAKQAYSKRRKDQILAMIEASRDSSISFTKSRDPQEIAEMMLKIVEHLFAIPRAEFLTESRMRDHVVRRCLVANLILTYTDLRDVAIGKIINRDRTSAIHMFRLHDDLIIVEKTYKDWFERASSLYARANFIPHIEDVTMDSIIERIIKLNEEVETLNGMLGNLLVNVKSKDHVTSTEQSLTD